MSKIKLSLLSIGTLALCIVPAVAMSMVQNSKKTENNLSNQSSRLAPPSVGTNYVSSFTATATASFNYDLQPIWSGMRVTYSNARWAYNYDHYQMTIHVKTEGYTTDSRSDQPYKTLDDSDYVFKQNGSPTDVHPVWQSDYPNHKFEWETSVGYFNFVDGGGCNFQIDSLIGPPGDTTWTWNDQTGYMTSVWEPIPQK